jgi:hypothetical protein
MSPVVASRPWNSEQDERLRALVLSGKHPAAIGKLLGRSEQAIRNRLYRLDHLNLEQREQQSLAQDNCTRPGEETDRSVAQFRPVAGPKRRVMGAQTVAFWVVEQASQLSADR